LESRKSIRKRLVKQKRSLFVQKSIGITAALASTSGVFTTLVQATEANASETNETEVAKSGKSSATATLAKSSNETAINQQFKTSASLNVRSDASTSASIISGVGKNATVKAVAKKSGTSVNGNATWYKLSTGGWISGAYVSASNSASNSSNTSSSNTSGETAVNKTVKTTTALNVRAGASTSSNVVRGLSGNTTVTVVAQKSGTSVNGNTTWYKLSNGGWITAAYVSAVTSDSSNANSGSTTTTEQAISKNVKTTASLNVRSSASTSGSIVGSLGNSTTVKVVAQKSGTAVNGNKTWYKLSTGGWITAAYVTETSGSGNSASGGSNSNNSSSSNNSAEQAVTKNLQTTTGLNVRSSASTSGSVVSSLSANAVVKAVAQKQGTSVNGNTTWYKLSTGGWITAAYVKEVSSNATTPGNSGSNNGNTNVSTNIDGAAIVAEARKYIGTPYQWGGKGPDVFDCSGFTRYVFLQVTGKNIGDWTVPQESAGTIIPVSQAQAGDLLFWGERGNSYHVAIATGNGSFIHAPSTGYTVTEASAGFSTASFALRVK
jgi:cell wall-associated NlpC family hydrolase